MRCFRAILALAIMSVPIAFLGFCFATVHPCVLDHRVIAVGLPRVHTDVESSLSVATDWGLLHPHIRLLFSVKLYYQALAACSDKAQGSMKQSC